MTSLKSILRVARTLVALAAIGTMMDSREAAAKDEGPAPVTIVSPLPLPVQAAGEPYQDRIPFSFSGSCSGSFCPVSFAPVPTGKRLVVTHVSGRLTLQGGARVQEVYFSESATTVDIRVHVPTFSEGLDFTGVESRQFSAQILLFVEAGNQPTAHFNMDKNPGSLNQEVGLAGYYLTAP